MGRLCLTKWKYSLSRKRNKKKSLPRALCHAAPKDQVFLWVSVFILTCYVRPRHVMLFKFYIDWDMFDLKFRLNSSRLIGRCTNKYQKKKDKGRRQICSTFSIEFRRLRVPAELLKSPTVCTHYITGRTIEKIFYEI